MNPEPRTLYYVPIIHSEADLGSLGPAVVSRGIAGLGREFWERHTAAVAAFWTAIGAWCDSLIRKVRDYQRLLPFFLSRRAEFDALSRYLSAPVNLPAALPVGLGAVASRPGSAGP